MSRRVTAALRDLAPVAPPERQEPLARQLRLLEDAATEADGPVTDLRTALTADVQGLGVGR